MTAFSDVKRTAPRTPGKTLLLEPWVFADDWSGKPRDPVCVGLRHMSQGDKNKARAEAERFALELHPKGGPNALDAFNDDLVRQCAALGICDPNDVNKPAPILPLAESEIRFAVTAKGARFIHDSVERYEIETSALYPEATEEDLEELKAFVSDPTVMALLPSVHAALVRRYLRFALDTIRDVVGVSDEPTAVDSEPRDP